MNIEICDRLQGTKLNKWEEFLKKAGLSPDLNTDCTVLVWEEDTIIASGSRYGNLLKCIAVGESHRGEDLTATVLTSLRQNAFRAGHDHLFLYTKPENKILFSSLFFYPVTQTKDVLLMENKKDGIKEFLKGLPHNDAGGKTGCLVMNCNPFTLGHRYLIEMAAFECDRVYVFVLSEDRSHFSAKDRMEMVKKGTADLENVTVLPTGPYLISSATFPTYFLKENTDTSLVQCELDVKIFTQYFVPEFAITHRYVGSEPFCNVTSKYNSILSELLPKSGIILRQVSRKEIGNTPISASRVREFLDRGNIEEVKKLLPKTTFEYFTENKLV